jgi:hypothetical protein
LYGNGGNDKTVFRTSAQQARRKAASCARMSSELQRALYIPRALRIPRNGRYRCVGGLAGECCAGGSKFCEPCARTANSIRGVTVSRIRKISRWRRAYTGPVPGKYCETASSAEPGAALQPPDALLGCAACHKEPP